MNRLLCPALLLLAVLFCSGDLVGETHRFTPTQYHDTFSFAHSPVLRIRPGDRVITRTIDARGVDEREETVAKPPNPQTGPFFVEGAEPGDMLVVHIEKIDPIRKTAWSSTLVAPYAADPSFLRHEGERRHVLENWVLDNEKRRPNILFIMTDQHRFDCLGANGNTLIRTPNLDRLAARSANLQNAFVQAPVCVPSRVTWFTGRYPHSHRNRVNYTPLTKAEVLMQKRLQQAGYATAAVGKLHLYPADQQEAKHSGFDRVALHDGAGITDPFSDYVRWRRANDPRRDTPYRAYAEDIGSGENPFRSAIADEFTDTTWTGMKAREFLQDLASGEKPFFLFVSFWKPHSPYEVPVPFASLYDDVEIPMPEVMSRDEIGRLPLPVQKMILRSEVYDMDRERLQWMYRSYYGSITHVDREVGSILDVLEKSGRSKDTIIIFSSDHGDQLLDHGMVGKNVFFETSIRVPFLFSFPGRVCPGDYHQLIETTDLLPTLFELAEVAVAPHTQGRSFARLIADAGSPYQERQYVFSENIMPEVITGGRFDYHFEKGKGVGGVRHPDAKMVRSQRWKLNYYPGNGGELYDLQNDPGEQRNLYRDEAHQPLVQQLKEKILDWMITSDETEQIAERWRLRR